MTDEDKVNRPPDPKKNKERKEAIDKTQARIDEFMQKTIQNIDRQRKQIKWSDDIENLNATKK